jgi:hypothetical protein
MSAMAWAAAFHPHQPLIATGGEDNVIPALGHAALRTAAGAARSRAVRDGPPVQPRRDDARVRLGRFHGPPVGHAAAGPARVAERLRADGALGAAERRAALRVLLETSRPSA